MRLLAALLLLALAAPVDAAERTDANLVTGIDMSESVAPASLRTQLAGLAAALRDPAFAAAAGSGAEGRIGFAVFGWHSTQVDIVRWTLVASPADAERIARILEARMAISPAAEARLVSHFAGRLTGVAAALDHARGLFTTAPWRADRAVLNLIGNGADNLRGESRRARDRLLDTGATINGVLLDADDEAPGHYAAQVIGGPGAFLIAGSSDADLAPLMRRKLLGDLLAALP
jgi:hypothetical protein